MFHVLQEWAAFPAEQPAHGYLEVLVAPLKALACRLGLASYGRNNLTYIPEWGSYFQLVGYVTELDLAEGSGSEAARLMADCETCGLCTIVCPAGAITDGRVLLHGGWRSTGARPRRFSPAAVGSRPLPNCGRWG